MSAILTEILERFLGSDGFRGDSILRFKRIQTDGEKTSENIPQLHVLVEQELASETTPLAVVVVSSPSTSPHSPEKLDFAVRKARAYKTPYFVTWTLREASLWKTPRPGSPVNNNALEKLREYPTIFQVGISEDDVVIEPVKLDILEVGRFICADLISLSKDEALELVQLDATYFVERLLQAVGTLVPVVTKTVASKLADDAAFRKTTVAWAPRQSISGSPDDPDFSESVARHTVYRLLGKIIFYQSLRKAHRQLPKLELEKVDVGQVLPTLWSAFKEALKIDYHSVFQEDVTDTLKWPESAATELAGLVNDFNTRDFTDLPQDVIGTVFERLIPPEERHLLGQYFTSEILCDLIVAFCVTSSSDIVLDPTCGTGTFLIRAYDRLTWLGCRNHAQLLERLWGVDIAPFPAELAAINLFGRKVAEHNNFPRIVCDDFLSISPGDTFPFPPTKVDSAKPEPINEPIPMFDAIVGNFPYVGGSQIERQEEGYLEKLRNCMIAGWLEKYPELFYYKSKAKDKIFRSSVEHGRHIATDKTDIELKLSVYADLYVYLFLHATRFLKIGGKLGIVTSNAWLDAEYGYQLQNFLLDHFKLVAVLESRCEPWFVEASVNTIVTVLERCDHQEQRDNNLVHFAKILKPLKSLAPYKESSNTGTKWQYLEHFRDSILSSSRKYQKTFPLGMMTEENSDARTRVLRQGEMKEKLRKSGKTVKWGRYLRAPDLYFEICESTHFCTLNELASPKRGGLSRINDFFYLRDEVIREFGIEGEYLLPLLKSPKSTNVIRIDTDTLDHKVFYCKISKADLVRKGHRGALRYIEWGEQQVYKKGRFRGLTWPEGTWVKSRKPGWWALPESEINPSYLFFSEAFGDRHLHRFSAEPIIPDKRIYYLEPNASGISPEDLAAVLNSSITSLALEVSGRVTMGDGVLEFSVEDARDYLLVPDLRKFTASSRSDLRSAFRQLQGRRIEAISQEVRQPDRKALDTAVLNAMGLDHKSILKPLYSCLCDLVQERHTLGRHRGRERNVRKRKMRTEDQLASQIISEFLPNGPKRFPDDFLSSSARKDASVRIELPRGKKVIFEDTPLLKRVYSPGTSFSKEISNSIEGKYIIYAKMAGHYRILMPSKMVEITRTVANFERYLRELRSNLHEAYLRATLDNRSAAKLTQAAIDKFRLPSISS